jgi:hypothetical protein
MNPLREFQWACLEDRAPLTPRGGALSCTACGREYEVVEGVPLFTRSAEDRANVERDAPVLDTIWRAMQTQPAADAASDFCRGRNCTRSPHSADWKFFLPIPLDGTTLELGAGFGDDSFDLAGKSGTTVPVVPTLLNARIVQKHVRERSGHTWPVAVMTDVCRLPLPEASVHAVSLEEAAVAGFGLSDARLPEAASEWARVLVPGGYVFLGVANRLHRMPGFSGLRSVLRARPRPESLNRLVKRSAAMGGTGRLSLGRTIRTMTAAGFSPPVVYTPLPDENDTQIVIPIDDAHVVRYFLDNLVRKNSRIVRIALQAARLSVTLGAFRRLVAHYYLIFRCDAPR